MVKVESLLQRGQHTGQNPSIGGTREFLSDFHVGMCLWYLAEAEESDIGGNGKNVGKVKKQRRGLVGVCLV